MIQQLDSGSEKILAFKLSGKLHDADYEEFVPAVEKAIDQQGKVRMLVHFEDFHGWDLHAVWDDTKFAARHFGDIGRLAMVGDRKWEEWMAKVCKPFTKAEIRYFDASEMDAAWAWIRATEQPGIR